MSEEELAEARRAFAIFQRIAEGMTQRELEALAEGLRTDDRRLLQAQTTWQTTRNGPCTGACALCYGHMILYPHLNEPEIDQRFCEIQEAYLTAHPANGKDFGAFLTWYDHVPREHLKAYFLPAVERAIARKLLPEA
jgi:hypothetical protein